MAKWSLIRQMISLILSTMLVLPGGMASDIETAVEQGFKEEQTAADPGVKEEQTAADPDAKEEQVVADPGVQEEATAVVKTQLNESYAYDAENVYKERFFVPTHVYHYGGEFYIADAYNHQILHTNNVNNSPYGWHPVGMGLNRPHAIASDGTLYLVVDTDNNRIVTYTRTDSGYQAVEAIDNVGVRPHYTEYDSGTQRFYVWSSMTGTMYIYKRSGMSLQLVSAKKIKALDGQYTRSFTIDGNTIYFPCTGLSAIYAVNKSDLSVKAIYPVASELSEMVQVIHVQNYYYMTTSNNPAKGSLAMIARARTLEGFGNGGYEDVRGSFGDIDGTPYYITQGEDGHFYAPVIEGSCNAYICRFDIANDAITNVSHMKY